MVNSFELALFEVLLEMSYNTRSKRGKKRGRPEIFYFNRSYYNTNSKQRRLSPLDMAEENSNMNGFQFIDLANSIINREPNNMNVNGNQQTGPEVEAVLDHEVRGMVQDEAASVQRSLEDKVKGMVYNEMSDVRKMIDSLSKNVKDLSEIVRGQSSICTNPNMVGPRPGSISNGDKGSSVSTPSVPSSNQQNYSRIRNVEIRAPQVNSYEAIQPAHNDPFKIRIDKLGLNFSGDTRELRVNDFIYRLEQMRAQYNIPWAEVLRDFTFLVSGQAREWYWLYRQSNVNTD